MGDPRGTMGDDELAAWLRLLRTPGVGRESARRLLAALGDPREVFRASVAALGHVVSAAQARALTDEPEGWRDHVVATQAWLDSAASRHVVAMGDPRYPQALLQTADPPLLLFVQGRLDLLARPSLAVVGSRRASAQGLDNAREFSRHLSQGGITIASGLAQGIDGAAHEGALDGEGSTVAVVGTGLDRVYPAAHQALAHRIGEHGALVSEFPLGTPPVPDNFPQRNRVIAGLSLGTLVVEAALQSGSLITARLAAEAGREVFAIPGSIHAPQSRGCHALIKQGAKLVECAADILDELPTLGRAGRSSQVSIQDAEPLSAGDPLLGALGHDPMTLDVLLARTGLPAAELQARLLELEFEGRVARLPGGLFQRRAGA